MGSRIRKGVYSQTVTMPSFGNVFTTFIFLIFSAVFPIVASSSTLTIPAMQWINVGSRLTGNAPVGLKNFGIGYYKDTNTMVIFGGTTASGNKNGQTYLANFNHLTWSSPTNPHGPQARSDMIYGMDVWGSYRNTFVITCGKGDGKDVMFNDTWAYDMVYNTWTQITNVTSTSGPVPQLYSAVGGIDTTTQTGSQVIPNNTMWMSHGTDGSKFYTDLWAQVFSGSWTPNENTLSTTWYKVQATGEIPQGRKEPAGTVLPGGRLAIYGGCNNSATDCAIPDVSALVLGNGYDTGIPTSVTASWSSKSQCLGAREDAAMVMNGISGVPAYTSQVIVFGGKLPNDTPIGNPGEVGIMDTSSGVWARVIPQGDGDSLPNIRAGARMVATGNTVISASTNISATDILMFGGEALDNSSTNLNDLWILRLYNIPTSADNPSNVTKMKFLDCIPISKEYAPDTSSGNDGSNDSNNGSSASVSKSHFLLSTLSYMFLSIATTILRFGYGVVSIWSIGSIYGALIVASYATAFYGFAVAFEDKSHSHFSTVHDILGLIILAVLYVLIPILVIISLIANKRFGSHAPSASPGESNDRGDGGGIGNKFATFLNSKSLETTNSHKSFEVNRGGNKSFYQNEGDPPISMFKPAGDSWVEKRKSVTESATHNNSSRGSMPNSGRVSQSTSASHHRLGSNGTPLTVSGANIPSGKLHQPKQNPLATLITHIYYVTFHIILLLIGIYLVYLFKANSVNDLFFYLLILFMIVMYASWIILAWMGYPKGRRSLLVKIMANMASGKGGFEDNEDSNGESESEYSDSRIINQNLGTGTSHRVIMTNVDEEEEMDEETKQAELEQEITNRDVVVMTIPKRRLTVVNA